MKTHVASGRSIPFGFVALYYAVGLGGRGQHAGGLRIVLLNFTHGIVDLRADVRPASNATQRLRFFSVTRFKNSAAMGT
jgi:hypothetical protein